MQQSELLDIVTNRFSEKFKSIAKVRVREFLGSEMKDDKPTIVITFLGLEEVANHHNMNEKIQVVTTDEKGSKVEYLTRPPSMFELSFIVTPYFRTYSDSLKIIGSIVQLVKDDNTINSEGLDWLGNNNRGILINPIQGMNIEKQIQLFNLIRTEYRPSLFYKVEVGIDSGLKENFRRVEERIITADPKKPPETEFTPEKLEEVDRKRKFLKSNMKK